MYNQPSDFNLTQLDPAYDYLSVTIDNDMAVKCRSSCGYHEVYHLKGYPAIFERLKRDGWEQYDERAEYVYSGDRYRHFLKRRKIEAPGD